MTNSNDYNFREAQKKAQRKSQLELGITRAQEPDRNFEKGGRSFYFFDLDDNVFFLGTPIYVFHKKTNAEIALSSGDFAKHLSEIGKSGIYKDYIIDPTDTLGSFRRFRDEDKPVNLRSFCEDLQTAIAKPEFDWKGPSWQCFYHAAFNQRPMSLITARGHAPETIKEGIKLFVRDGHLPFEPNYLSLYPVSHPETQNQLTGGKMMSTAELKLRAVIESVEMAMKTYGINPHHRFGMSDDDPKNLELIYKAMLILKHKYPDNSFFVIHTHESDYVKEEVFLNHTERHTLTQSQLQLDLSQPG
ncbi:MAG: hypothetical protein V4596_06555 [Bdellovibrionota bacterium]